MKKIKKSTGLVLRKKEALQRKRFEEDNKQH